MIVRKAGPQTFDQEADCRCLCGVVAIFLQIDIVHDLADAADSCIGNAKSHLQHLKRAEAALVPETTAIHVERDTVGGGTCVRHEVKTRLGIDESPDEPGGRESVDAWARPGDPKPASVLGLVELLGWRRLEDLSFETDTLEGGQLSFGILRAGSREKIDLPDFTQTFAQLPDRADAVRAAIVRLSARPCLRQLAAKQPIVFGAGGAKLFDDFTLLNSID